MVGRARTILTGAGAFSVALLIGLLVSFGFEASSGRHAVPARVELAVPHQHSEPLSGLPVEDALQRARSRSHSFLQGAVTLASAHKTEQVHLGELGVEIPWSKLEQRLQRVSREQDGLSGFGNWLVRLLRPERIELPVTVDSSRLQRWAEPWIGERFAAPVEPRVHVDGEQLVVREAIPGLIVDLPLLEKRIVRWLDVGGEIQVPTRRLDPRVDPGSVQVAHAQAKALLDAPFRLVTGEGTEFFSLTPEELGRALDSEIVGEPPRLQLKIWPEKIRHELRDILAKFERPAQSAQFDVGSGGDITIIPSAAGVALDAEELVQRLFAATASGDRQIELPLRGVEPDLTTDQAEALGISGLVSSFTTRHPCCRPRVDNIHAAAAEVDGTLLRPGERFSLNAVLGPRAGSGKYKRAPTIVRGKMKETPGGGISQFATTLFNAVLDGGYAIVQRQPHSYYFSRYPEGHEATVSYPEPDLIFENDTESGLLVKTHYGSTFIKVLLYGDNGGRAVRRTKSQRFDLKEPPKEYEPDPDMPVGRTKRLRAGQYGWSVIVARIINYPDGRKKEEKRKVIYKPRPELLRVHPCMIPRGSKGFTGEACPEPAEPEEPDDVESAEAADEAEFLDDSIPDEERVQWDVE